MSRARREPDVAIAIGNVEMDRILNHLKHHVHEEGGFCASLDTQVQSLVACSRQLRDLANRLLDEHHKKHSYCSVYSPELVRQLMPSLTPKAIDDHDRFLATNYLAARSDAWERGRFDDGQPMDPILTDFRNDNLDVFLWHAFMAGSDWDREYTGPRYSNEQDENS